MNRFDKKVVIVTNAGTSIGAATAKRFLSEGASVVLNGYRENLTDTADGMDLQRLMLHDGDVSDEAYIQCLLGDTVSRFGHIDVLVNNVRPSISGAMLNNTAEQWYKVLNANVSSVFLAVRSALPYLIPTGGAIVNVSLAFENDRLRGGSSYNASQGAVKTFTRFGALELASEGVRMNVVSPRLTSTAMAVDLDNNKPLAITKKKIPVGRSAVPEEVASVIAFLASRDAAFVNGVDLPVDGGFTVADR